MLISVHIPKTAGTSFRFMLHKHFDKRLGLDYSDQPVNGNFFKDYHEGRISWQPDPEWKILSQRYDCIHGHFLAKKYKTLLPDAKLIVWLRDPIERALSNLRYLQDKIQQEIAKKEADKIDFSVENFANNIRYQNMQSYFLSGVSLQDFDFIGIAEDFERGIKLFSKKFSVDLNNYEIPHAQQVNAPKDKGGKHITTDFERNILIAANKKDIELYQQAKHYHKELCKQFNV